MRMVHEGFICPCLLMIFGLCLNPASLDWVNMFQNTNIAVQSPSTYSE